MNTLNVAMSILCLSFLCLVLAGQIERANERKLSREAQAWDGCDGENFI